MTHARKLAVVDIDEPADAWVLVDRPTAARPMRAPATLYIRGAQTPFIAISTVLLDAIGDPDHVAIHVNPRRRQIRLFADPDGHGRRIRRPASPRGQRATLAATRIPEALGIRKALATLRFDAAAAEDHVTLTLRGES